MDSPEKLSAHLRQVASKIDQSEKPDRRLVMRELRATLASIQFIASEATSGLHTVGLYGVPGTSFKHEDTDMTSMMEAPFREAGASHFSWTKGGCQMMVPPEALSAVLQALQAAQAGSYGDDLQKFYDGFQHEYTLDHAGARVVASARTAGGDQLDGLTKMWYQDVSGAQGKEQFRALKSAMTAAFDLGQKSR